MPRQRLPAAQFRLSSAGASRTLTLRPRFGPPSGSFECMPTAAPTSHDLELQQQLRIPVAALVAPLDPSTRHGRSRDTATLHAPKEAATSVVQPDVFALLAHPSPEKTGANPEPPSPEPAALHPRSRELIKQLRGSLFGPKGEFAVRAGKSHESAIHATVERFIAAAEEISGIARDSAGRYSPLADLREVLGLYTAFTGHVDVALSPSSRTVVLMEITRRKLVRLLPAESRREWLGDRSNPLYLDKIDEAIRLGPGAGDRERSVRAAIRQAQPAAVWINRASGINLSPDGLILTNAHVALEVGRRMKVQFPSGLTCEGSCTALDTKRDLALVKLDALGVRLPAAILERAEAPVGSDIVVIGQPENYDYWHVSVGKIDEYKETQPWMSPKGDRLGRLRHHAWTSWGSSGSPMFNFRGRVVGLHSSWDEASGARHGIAHRDIASFLREQRATFTLADD